MIIYRTKKSNNYFVIPVPTTRQSAVIMSMLILFLFRHFYMKIKTSYIPSFPRQGSSKYFITLDKNQRQANILLRHSRTFFYHPCITFVVYVPYSIIYVLFSVIPATERQANMPPLPSFPYRRESKLIKEYESKSNKS
jgi:hypothetical protein